jgi:hypothetical protein
MKRLMAAVATASLIAIPAMAQSTSGAEGSETKMPSKSTMPGMTNECPPSNGTTAMTNGSSAIATQQRATNCPPEASGGSGASKQNDTGASPSMRGDTQGGTSSMPSTGR